MILSRYFNILGWSGGIVAHYVIETMEQLFFIEGFRGNLQTKAIELGGDVNENDR